MIYVYLSYTALTLFGIADVFGGLHHIQPSEKKGTWPSMTPENSPRKDNRQGNIMPHIGPYLIPIETNMQ